MSNDPQSVPTPNPAPGSGATGHYAPHVEARWERPVVAADGGEATLLVRVVAPASDETGNERAAPLDVAFVLDRSGSMTGGKLELGKEGVDLAAARLRDADRVALVVYDNAVDTVHPLAAATPRGKAALRLALHGIDPGGSTFLSGGWVAGCQQLAEALADSGNGKPDTRIRRAILLTDGLANVGIVDPGELSRHAGELRQRGIATTTVGVGADFDEGLLSAMAEAGGGNFQYVADPGELRAFFATELQELFSVGATGFTVSISLPAGAAAELVSAFPAETTGNRIEVAIGDLPAGDTIDLVFAVRTETGDRNQELPFAVSACWTDPRADARRKTAVALEPLRRVSAEELAGAAHDEQVTEQAALQRAAAERRAGLELDRAGRIAESRARMANAQFLLQAAPNTAAVERDLNLSAMLAEDFKPGGYDSHVRKSAQFGESQRRRGRAERRAEDAHGS